MIASVKGQNLLALFSLALLLAVPDASALSSYQSRVPNGTVSSCDTCHDPVAGPPVLNQFGGAFLTAGLAWTPALAALDSDGDGFTNGQELGDPAGAWTPGTANPTGTITNPGDPASHAPTTAPAITTQPASQTVLAGANATFTVVASGSPAPTYRWQKNTVDIPGATSDTLTINGVATGDAGAYRVIVSNIVSTATSDPATLTVNHAPVAQSINAGTRQGQTQILSAAKLISRATDADGDPLTLTGVSATSTQGGTVSLSAGEITYSPASLFVGDDTFTYTISDGRGGTATATVTVTVTPANAESVNIVYGPLVTGGNFVVRFGGIPGYTYTIESTDSLAPATWVKKQNSIAPVIAESFGIGVFEFSESTGGAPARFYRAVWPSY